MENVLGWELGDGVLFLALLLINSPLLGQSPPGVPHYSKQKIGLRLIQLKNHYIRGTIISILQVLTYLHLRSPMI